MDTWAEEPFAGCDNDSAVPQLRSAKFHHLPQAPCHLLGLMMKAAIAAVEKTEYLSTRLRRAPCGNRENHQTAKTFMKRDLVRDTTGRKSKAILAFVATFPHCWRRAKFTKPRQESERLRSMEPFTRRSFPDDSAH